MMSLITNLFFNYIKVSDRYIKSTDYKTVKIMYNNILNRLNSYIFDKYGYNIYKKTFTESSNNSNKMIDINCAIFLFLHKEYRALILDTIYSPYIPETDQTKKLYFLKKLTLKSLIEIVLLDFKTNEIYTIIEQNIIKSEKQNLFELFYTESNNV